MTEITDEMVQRALEGFYGEGFRPCGDTESRMKSALRSALNPAPEHEIVVTEEMIDAAWGDWPRGVFINRIALPAFCRAMRKLEPPPEEPLREHHRDGELQYMFWHGRYEENHTRNHRRKDDPR